MRRLRIAVYHNLHSGGAKRVTVEHLRRLSERHDVVLHSLHSADHQFAAERGGRDTQVLTFLRDYQALRMARSPFGRINPALRMLNLRRMDDICRAIAAAIDRSNYDVVLLHPCQMTQAPLVLRWLKTPSLYYVHELPRLVYEQPVFRPYTAPGVMRRTLDHVDPLRRSYSALLGRLDRLSAQRATQLAANSKQTRRDCEVTYGRPATVCPPGVDIRFFQSQSTKLEHAVLSVGALTPLKGFDFIIQAIATLDAAIRPSLVIISNYQEPQELHHLTALAEQHQVRVEFKVNIPDQDLMGWYARAGCVAYAPIREPLGLVALEAMAAGAPIIGVAEGGVLETIVDGVTGLLVPRDPQIFGSAIHKMLAHPEMAEQFAKAARKHVRENFSWERHMEQLELLLGEVAASATATYPTLLPAKQTL